MPIRFKPLWLAALPHHAISRLVFRLARLRSPLVTPAIRWFAARYRVALEEADPSDPAAYPTFNAFFTRALKPGARPIVDQPGAIACPVDGRISAIGRIAQQQIFQAKGHSYALHELLADEARAAPYRNGHFATLYLSPRDYHRVHMPLGGRLKSMSYVPGRLFSVAPDTVEHIPRLFARNERVIAHFDTECGPMAVVLVGAINVAAIETVWAGLVTPPHRRLAAHIDYPASGGRAVRLRRGEELGRFNLGSTVILIFGPDAVAWTPGLGPGDPVRMGQKLGQCRA